LQTPANQIREASPIEQQYKKKQKWKKKRRKKKKMMIGWMKNANKSL